MGRISITLLLFWGYSQLYAAGMSQAAAERIILAESGVPEAQYRVAQMYESGVGVNKSLPKAISYYKRASEQGHAKSMFKRGFLNYKGLWSYSVDYKEALVWFKKAADAGNRDAAYYIGRMYSRGQGVKIDTKLSKQWYKKSTAKKKVPPKTATHTYADITAKQPPAVEAIVQKKAESPPPPTIAAKITPVKIPPVDKEIMRSAWQNDDHQPAEILPSSVVTCKPKAKRIVCMSDILSRTRGKGSFKYKSKAILSHFNHKKRQFIIKYRNLIISSQGDDVVVKKGWQKAMHEINCRFRDDNQLLCIKNGRRGTVYKRVK